MRIYDCFPYNGESIALFRLQYLWDVVDEFIIIEALETHVGVKKQELHLEKNAALFEKYNKKITRLIIDQFPAPDDQQLSVLAQRHFVEKPQVWFRESYQRNFAETYLREKLTLAPWLLFVCDVDEIPRREMVENLYKFYDYLAEPHKLQMHFFYYSSDWIKRFTWDHPFVISDQGLGKYPLDEIRVNTAFAKWSLKQAGWHFSYFMTQSEIRAKIETMAHTEFANENNKDMHWLEHCRKTGKDLYHRGVHEDCLRYTGEDLPQGLRVFEKEIGIRL